MTGRALLRFGVSALACGSILGGGAASAGTHVPRKDAARAVKALAKHDAVAAVGFAEAAVAGEPSRAEYRLLLARSYLQAGRFPSARDAFADALRLAPDNGGAALNLALAQIATGDLQVARTTLAAYAPVIAAADRGLALALAGDPTGGVTLLTAAARTPGADARVRQNLGLAYALAGRWGIARVVAAADLSPADVDARMEQWAQFVRPVHASDQVAALLGVRAVEDRGLPVALALVEPGVRVADVVVPAPAVAVSRIVFAPRREVVQTLPRMRSAEAKLVPGGAAGAGDWVVQLGAFADARHTRHAWEQATRRFGGLGGGQPRETTIRTGRARLHRLSVAGFDRGGADALCAAYRKQGGVCFVRQGAGDRVAQWHGVRVASR